MWQKTGYYKRVFMSVNYNEIYIFPDRKMKKPHTNFYVLSQGVLIKLHPPREVAGQEIQTAYPIEIILRSGSMPKQIFFYFSNEETQKTWTEKFRKAAGHYNISDFYKMETTNFIYTYQSSSGYETGELIQKQIDTYDLNIDQLQWPESIGQTFIFPAIHKKTKLEMDVKMICKKEMSLTMIEQMKDEANLLILAQNKGVIKIYDFFENFDYFFLCVERFNTYKKNLIKRVIEKEDFFATPPPLSLKEYIYSQTFENDQWKYEMREKRIIHITYQLL